MGIPLKDFVALRKRQGCTDPLLVEEPPKNKFGVSPKDERTIDNIVFASKREAYHYAVLKIAADKGIIQKLELQPRFLIYPACRLPTGRKQRKIEYRADFRFIRDGKTVVVDVKAESFVRGKKVCPTQTPQFRMKWKMVTTQHPEIIWEIWP